MGILESWSAAEVLVVVFFLSHTLQRHQRLLQFSLRVLATRRNFGLKLCIWPHLDGLDEVSATFLLAAQPESPDGSGTAADLTELSTLGEQTSIVADWRPFSLLPACDLTYKNSWHGCRFCQSIASVESLPTLRHLRECCQWLHRRKRLSRLPLSVPDQQVHSQDPLTKCLPSSSFSLQCIRCRRKIASGAFGTSESLESVHPAAWFSTVPAVVCGLSQMWILTVQAVVLIFFKFQVTAEASFSTCAYLCTVAVKDLEA